MAEGAAKESKLAALHDVVATVLIEQVGERAEEVDEDSGETIELYTASPALLTAAMKFLKDNDITCVPAQDSKTQQLKDKLAERKRGHGNVIAMTPQADEHAIG